ncbi:MAG: glycoside hydrolase, partial [Planctomycetaceae bacterium]|nr:glycoside hydrolase [Planctomycetaceae bacterium]
ITERTAERSHLQAFISDDDGKTWKGGLMLDERKGVSYPDGDQTKDGTIFVIYDFDRTGAKEILMARFTEEDVLAGKVVTSNSALRLLVNKAAGVIPKP